MQESLSANELEKFQACGIVHLREAFPQDAALSMQDFMWSQLATLHGVKQDDRSTWSLPQCDLNQTAANPIYDAIAAPRLCGAIDQLLGTGNWNLPKSWGGFLVTFPEGQADTWRLRGKMWHWDGDVVAHLGRERPKGLFIFTLFSEIAPCGGGTFLVEGSHCLINRCVAELLPNAKQVKQAALKKHLYQCYSWLNELVHGNPDTPNRAERFMNEVTVIDGIPLRVIEIVGGPGDVYICHPTIFHSASFNHADRPRFMRAKGLEAKA